MSSLFYSGQTDYINKLNLVGSKYVKNTFTCSTSSTKTIDLSAGHTVVLNITGASAVSTTLAFSNLPDANTPIELTIYAVITNAAAHTINWPAEVRVGTVSGASTTNLTNGSGKTDIFILRSYDAGTTFYMTIVQQNYAT